MIPAWAGTPKHPQSQFTGAPTRYPSYSQTPIRPGVTTSYSWVAQLPTQNAATPSYSRVASPASNATPRFSVGHCHGTACDVYTVQMQIAQLNAQRAASGPFKFYADPPDLTGCSSGPFVGEQNSVAESCGVSIASADNTEEPTDGRDAQEVSSTCSSSVATSPTWGNADPANLIFQGPPAAQPKKISIPVGVETCLHENTSVKPVDATEAVAIKTRLSPMGDDETVSVRGELNTPLNLSLSESLTTSDSVVVERTVVPMPIDKDFSRRHSGAESGRVAAGVNAIHQDAGTVDDVGMSGAPALPTLLTSTMRTANLSSEDLIKSSGGGRETSSAGEATFLPQQDSILSSPLATDVSSPLPLKSTILSATDSVLALTSDPSRQASPKEINVDQTQKNEASLIVDSVSYRIVVSSSIAERSESSQTDNRIQAQAPPTEDSGIPPGALDNCASLVMTGRVVSDGDVLGITVEEEVSSPILTKDQSAVNAEPNVASHEPPSLRWHDGHVASYTHTVLPTCDALSPPAQQGIHGAFALMPYTPKTEDLEEQDEVQTLWPSFASRSPVSMTMEIPSNAATQNDECCDCASLDLETLPGVELSRENETVNVARLLTASRETQNNKKMSNAFSSHDDNQPHIVYSETAPEFVTSPVCAARRRVAKSDQVDNDSKSKAVEEATRIAEEEASAKAEEDANMVAGENAKAQAEKEARAKIEGEAHAKAVERARATAEDEARICAEAAAKAKIEEVEEKAKDEAKRAAQVRKEAVAKFLTAHKFKGVNTGRRSLTKTTYPLHEAAKRNDIEMVKMLVEEGASVDQKNSRKQTPLQRASRQDKRNSHKDMIDMLRVMSTQ